jgi:hypothetical protein
MATKKEVFNEDFLKIRSNIPTLRKGESAESFRKRVKMWSSRTGLKFPTSGKQKTLFGAVVGMTKEAEALAGKSGTGQGFGIEDFSSGYETELNKLIQSNMRRVEANQKANNLRDNVPTSGMSDIRGDLKIKQDEEAAAEDKIMFGDDIMNLYGPGGAKNDPTDTYDTTSSTPLGAARRASFDPDSDDTDFNNNYDALENKVSGLSSANTNGTSTRRNLMVGPATGRAALREENIARFGEGHVNALIERNQAFQAAKGGGREAMKVFRNKYGKSLSEYLRKIRR